MKVTVLNGTLKPTGVTSETARLIRELLAAMRKYGKVDARVIRLADLMLPNVKGVRPFTGDKKLIIDAVLACDLLVMATPIWWGLHSSAIQHAIEYLDDQDDIHILQATGEESKGRSVATLKTNRFIGKQAIVAVTGAEDGVQHVVANLIGTLHWLGFTIPGAASVSYLATKSRQETADMVGRSAAILMNAKK